MGRAWMNQYKLRTVVIHILLLTTLTIGNAEKSEIQNLPPRQRRLSILRRIKALIPGGKTVSNSTQLPSTSTVESTRTRKYSAEEHAERFAPFESGPASALIKSLVEQTDEPRTEHARMVPIPRVVSYHDGETIATIYSDSNGNITRCSLFEIKHLEDSERILAQFEIENKKPVQKINFRTMLTVITACQAIDPVSSSHTSLKESVPTEVERSSPRTALSMRTVISGILPGTKWCGLGDIAKNYEDLGQEKDLDKCCRAHDHCPTKLRSFRSGYGLINWSLYTKSHCDCDSLLYECLKKSGGTTSDLLGNFYFNVLQVQCIDEENPVECLVRAKDNSCQSWGPTVDKLMFFRDVRRQF